LCYIQVTSVAYSHWKYLSLANCACTLCHLRFVSRNNRIQESRPENFGGLFTVLISLR